MGWFPAAGLIAKLKKPKKLKEIILKTSYHLLCEADKKLFCKMMNSDHCIHPSVVILY